MNFTWSRALALSLLPAALAHGEEPSVAEWTWRPAVYLLGTFDDTTGRGAASFDGELGEPSPGLGLGATLDAERQWSRGSLETSVVALTRSPQDAGDRSVSLAGRVHATRALGARVRLALTDAAKLQRRARGLATDFQRNELRVEGRWLAGRWWDLGLKLTDRRRAVEGVPVLGFDFQEASLGWFTRPARGFSLGLEAGAQRYHAPTAEGQSWRLALEAARVQPRGVVALRALYLEPLRARPLTPALIVRAESLTAAAPAAPVPPLPNVVNDVARLYQAVAAAAPATGVSSGDDALAETLWLDPLDEDADEWDFGRRKRALTAFGTRRLGERAAVSARASLVSRRGPDLLQPAPTPDYHELRFELRAGASMRLGRRTAVLVQASYLDSSGDRATRTFRRVLMAAGLQFRF